MSTVNAYHYETLDLWKILETAKEKNQVTHARLNTRMSFDFSIAIVDRVLKFLKEIYFQSRILHPAELSIKDTGVYTLPKQEKNPKRTEEWGGKGEKGSRNRKQDPTQERSKGNSQDGSRTKSQNNSCAGL